MYQTSVSDEDFVVVRTKRKVKIEDELFQSMLISVSHRELDGRKRYPPMLKYVT